MPDPIPSSLTSIFERADHPFHMWEGLHSMPQGMEDILRSHREPIRKAAQGMHGKNPVHLLGCGTSWFAAMALAHAFQQIAGVPAYAWEANEFELFPPLEQAGSVIGISHTGGTAPVINALSSARALGAVTVGYTDRSESPLGRVANFLVPSSLGMEPALPKTRSYAAALMRGYLHALELGKLNGKDTAGWEKSLLTAPEVFCETIETCAGPVQALAERWIGTRRVIVSGGGPHWATAMEGVLKMTEAALLDAITWQIEEAVHGTWANVRPGDLVTILAMEGPTLNLAHRLAVGMKMVGCKVWVITNRPWTGVDVDAITSLPDKLPELFMPLVAIAPLYLFAYFSALGAGISPDNMNLSNPNFLKARGILRTQVA